MRLCFLVYFVSWIPTPGNSEAGIVAATAQLFPHLLHRMARLKKDHLPGCLLFVREKGPVFRFYSSDDLYSSVLLPPPT